ncbi:MAG: hypothetical protein AUJ56_09750 [Zetaproteobacteria bacterium CG1_02_49_23]|nr:MAG: hypothetical protein AUJ56_09750 [Zetaproteobacteria bacterium CG1_02_49_23]
MIEIKIIDQSSGEQLDRGLLYAEACFETFRVIDGQVFAVDYHIRRMQLGLAALGIDICQKALQDGFERCVQAATQKGSDVLVRFTISGGLSGWGLNRPQHLQPAAYIHTMVPLAQAAQHLMPVEYPFPMKDRPAKFTADYGEFLRARQYWKTQCPEGFHPLLCQQGRWISSATANILLFDGQQWLTPPIGPGVLPGTLRQALLAAGCVGEKELGDHFMEHVQAMACINSGAWIVPVSQLAERLLDVNHAAFAALHEALAARPGVPAMSTVRLADA